MRILIDVLHPAQVHFFRHFITEMKGNGHIVSVTARAKEMTTDLLQLYDIPHEVLSRQPARKLELGLELLMRTFRLIRYARAFKPDVLTGVMGPSIAPAGRILRVPSIVFYNTEHAQTNRFVYPLARAVCTPRSYSGTVNGRHITYPGNHELAYLHPKRFRPDPSALPEFGLSHEQPYFLVRFVSWQSIHDLGDRGLSPETKVEIVKLLESRGRVVISSEGSVPTELEKLLLRGPVHKIHHVIAHAKGVIGESATMCSEAAVLGVPAVYLNPVGRGYLTEEQNRYGLVRNINPGDKQGVMTAVRELPWTGIQKGHRDLLKETTDVTKWMIDFFETEFANPTSPASETDRQL